MVVVIVVLGVGVKDELEVCDTFVEPVVGDDVTGG